MGQDASSLKNLENKIGYTFKDVKLLEESVSHSSSTLKGNYERLEFLGDSVLSTVIADYLFRSMPNANEGTMSQRRAELVGKMRQRQIAEQIGLQNFIRTGPGFQQALFRSIEDPLEAIIGGVFIDAGGFGVQGMQKAKEVIYKLWELQDPAGKNCVIT